MEVITGKNFKAAFVRLRFKDLKETFAMMDKQRKNFNW